MKIVIDQYTSRWTRLHGLRVGDRVLVSDSPDARELDDFRRVLGENDMGWSFVEQASRRLDVYEIVPIDQDDGRVAA